MIDQTINDLRKIKDVMLGYDDFTQDDLYAIDKAIIMCEQLRKAKKKAKRWKRKCMKYAEQDPKILDTIDFAIDASNGDTNYFVGLRNGLRYAKSLVDGEEPQYESCAEQEPCEDAISRQAVEKS